MEFNNLNTSNSFNLPNWTRLSVDDHENYRFSWVRETIRSFCSSGESLLDVGSGRQPFRNFIEEFGVKYVSHDFTGYQESDKQEFGLHNFEVPTGNVDIVCDILEIPTDLKFDVVLCTEVFEHVPDPVKALRKISELVRPGGFIILTFPGLSWTHQAPYYFSSGLSPFWINHHASELGLSIVQGKAVGEMRDLLKYVMPIHEVGLSGLFLRALGISYRFLAKRNKRIISSTNEAVILQNLVVLRCL